MSNKEIERAVMAVAMGQGQADSKPKGRVVATFDYTDADGALLYQVLKYEPKNFRQRRPDGHGGFIWNLDDVQRVPYRLSELLKYPDAAVFVCEGEKDADRVASLGHCATAVASSAWDDRCIRPLAGRDCIILQDNDEPGAKKALKAAQALHGVAKSVRIVLLPDLLHKEDVSDWLDADPRRSEKFVDICFNVPEWTPSSSAPAPTVPEEGAARVLPAPKQARPANKPRRDDNRPGEDRIALDFAEQHASDFRYIAEWNRWMRWDGIRWQHENTLKAFDEARVLCREADNAKAKTVAAVVTLARTDRAIAATEEQWDDNIELFNMPTEEAT